MVDVSQSRCFSGGHSRSLPPLEHDTEAGFMLLAVIVMVALVLLTLAVAAPIVAKELRRDKEVESEHRAEQYTRAIRLYYRRFHSYPPSLDALKQSNNIRFLRQVYPDPLTGKADWRLIHVGEQKTTVKGFFGEPLGGLQTTGVGGGSTTTSAFGGSSGGAFGSSSGSSFGATSGATSSSPSSGTSSNPLGSSTSSSTIGATSGLAAGFAGATIGSGGATGSSSSGFASGGVGQIMGVGSARSGASILAPNEQGTYETWEFLYDPRIEQLYAKSNILGGGAGVPSANGIGKDATTALSGASGATGVSGAFGTTGATSKP